MTHYLKCNNCGKLNEIKSEYVVLCTSCGQKLENNFTQWKHRNPGSTFEDYKNNVCLTESQLPPEPPRSNSRRTLKSRSLKEKILIVVTVVLFAGIGSWFGSSAVRNIQNSKKTDKKVLSEQWVKKTYGSYGLSIETPWELKPAAPLPLPENVNKMLDRLESFESQNDDQFKIGVVSGKYNPAEVIDMSLQGAADGAVNEVRNMPGVTNFVYSQDSYSVNDIPGFIQRGTYNHRGFKIGFINVGVVKDYNYWQVMILGRENDEIAQKAAERIIKSIQIDY